MERTQWKNGLHILEFELPDIYHCRVIASVTLDEVKETMRVLNQEIFPKVGKVFFFMHLGGMDGSLPPEARKYISSLTPTWKAMMLIGGNPILRRTTDLMVRAVHLLSHSSTPTRMVENAEQAYSIAGELRAAERMSAARS